MTSHKIGRTLRLPEDARGMLAGVHGAIIQAKDLDISRNIITVGDVCSAKCIEAGVRPELVVVDGKTKRGNYDTGEPPEGYSRVIVRNPAGHLTPELFEAIAEAERRAKRGGGTYMVIEGEEDLATIPIILAFPEGSQIVYGVPDVGMAMLIITSEFKEKAQRLLESMH